MIDELYRMLKNVLQNMRDTKADSVSLNYCEVAQLFQLVCFVKQMREIVNYGYDKPI